VNFKLRSQENFLPFEQKLKKVDLSVKLVIGNWSIKELEFTGGGMGDSNL
jgi:hypothetical protein